MKELKITDFVNQLASDQPTPGGGAAAGVTASLGIGAILMAMIFSKTKKMTEEEQEFLLGKIDQYQQSKEVFIGIIDRDATEFEPLSKAYRMPKDSEEEQAKRHQAIQEGLEIASQPPIDLVQEVDKILVDFDRVIPLIKKMIISDVGVGLQMLCSALNASSLNLYINGGQLSDEGKQKEYYELADQKVKELSEKLDSYYEEVKKVLVP